MNEQEHLLTCLIEECAEVQKAASKALRFGLNDRRTGASATNEADICEEISDVLSIVGMLQTRNLLTCTIGPCRTKQLRVRHYMDVAKTKGTLDR
jgi:hypothetical protein